MPKLLKLPSIEAKKKNFTISEAYDSDIVIDEAIGNDLELLRQCVNNGTQLPERFYRKNRHSTSDALLESESLMHLHVGSNRKDLLFLYQYDTDVLVVWLTDHSPFSENPVAGRILSVHKPILVKWELKQSAFYLAILEAKRSAVKAGILKRKK